MIREERTADLAYEISVPHTELNHVSLITDIPKVVFRPFTIIIPAYNEEDRIGPVLSDLCSFIKKFQLPWDVLVSIDGDDRTREIVDNYSRIYPFICTVFRHDRKGKGYAIKDVVDRIDSEFVIVMDADYSTNIYAIVKHIHLLEKYDVVVYSRYFSHENCIPPTRRLISRGFNLLVRKLLNLDLQDTQSGYKAFKKELFEKSMRKVMVYNSFYDVSLLFHILSEGGTVKEVPIKYDHRKGSKFSMTGLILNLGISLILFRIRYSRFFKYVPPELIGLYERRIEMS